MMHLVALAAALAQLSPTVGSPLPGSTAPGSRDRRASLVRLPASLGMRQRVLALHGTEIYKLPVWSATCPVRGTKAKPQRVYAVIGSERRGVTYVVHTSEGPRDFPLSCRLAPVRGNFTLLFLDPGASRPVGLATRTPDYTVP